MACLVAGGSYLCREAGNTGQGLLVQKIGKGEGLFVEPVECEAPSALGGVLGEDGKEEALLVRGGELGILSRPRRDAPGRGGGVK